MWIILAAAIAPALLLLYYVYSKDFNPEPPKMVFKGFFYGALAVLASFLFSGPMTLFGLIPETPASLAEAARLSFLGAAVPEESAKLLLLWLLLRNCREFDEHYDGLVYAAAVGLGFACVENIMYVLSAGAGWFQVSVVRALFAVPGHFAFAIVMGYYYSRCHFDWTRTTAWDKIKVWLFPVLLHGTYDTLAFSSGLGDGWCGLLSLVLLGFCFFLFRATRRRILEQASAARRNADPIDEQ